VLFEPQAVPIAAPKPIKKPTSPYDFVFTKLGLSREREFDPFLRLRLK
jgi:hypothetical protein